MYDFVLFSMLSFKPKIMRRMSNWICVRRVNKIGLRESSTCDSVLHINYCTCLPYQIKQKGICVNCSVANCRLCSIDSPLECDICASGYILDSLTKTSCVPAIMSQPVCISRSCLCQVNEIYISGTCTACSVSNCRLCNI